jgi:hypothetical protein
MNRNKQWCDIVLWSKKIRECPGVYSNAPTLEKRRNELEEVLEEWILFRVYRNLEISLIDNIEIKIKKQAVA